MEWYYTIGQDRRGPVDDAAFEALIADGTITPDALVWNAQMPDWVALDALRPSASAGSPPPPLPAVATLPVPARDTFQRVYFGLLFLQVLLGLLQRAIYLIPGYLAYNILFQMIFWVGLGTGALALWEQGRNAPRGLRLCVALPLAWSLMSLVLSRAVMWQLRSAGDGNAFDGATGLITLLQVFGYTSLGLHIVCAGIGFNLLSRQRAGSR